MIGIFSLPWPSTFGKLINTSLSSCQSGEGGGPLCMFSYLPWFIVIIFVIEMFRNVNSVVRFSLHVFTRNFLLIECLLTVRIKS